MQTSVRVSSDATTTQQQRRRRLQRRQSHRDDYNGHYYYNCGNYDDNHDSDRSYDHYYSTLPPRAASACNFRDVADDSDDDSGLCVRRIAVGPC